MVSPAPHGAPFDGVILTNSTCPFAVNVTEISVTQKLTDKIGRAKKRNPNVTTRTRQTVYAKRCPRLNENVRDLLFFPRVIRMK